MAMQLGIVLWCPLANEAGSHANPATEPVGDGRAAAREFRAQ